MLSWVVILSLQFTPACPGPVGSLSGPRQPQTLLLHVCIPPGQSSHYGWQNHPSANLFRMNTCKSVLKQTTLSIFRMNTYEKHRGWGAVMVNQLPSEFEMLSAEVVAPCMTVIELDERTREKSWAGGGGGVSERDEAPEDAPPPQPAHAASIMPRTEFGTPSCNRPTECPRVHSAPLAGTSLSLTQASRGQRAYPERIAAPNSTNNQVLVKLRNIKSGWLMAEQENRRTARTACARRPSRKCRCGLR
jgi:hypothetical protein